MVENQQDLMNELETGQGDWDSAKEAPRSGAEQLPSGTYLWKITNAYVGRSSVAGRLQLRVDIIALEAPTEEAKGRSYFKTWGLENAENLRWLAGDLLNLNLKLPEQKKKIMTETCEQLIGICFEGNVRPARDPQYGPNVWIGPNARRDESGEAVAF